MNHYKPALHPDLQTSKSDWLVRFFTWPIPTIVEAYFMLLYLFAQYCKNNLIFRSPRVENTQDWKYIAPFQSWC